MSTGPTGGSGGTTGPGHFLRGAHAISARPLTDERRRDNYRRQNGTRASGQLTPRQRRRADHKANRAAVRLA
ncbi:hypothetical protein [Micromonospora aurantiaca (nom. illeg.)]|uniref:hypothetical protein n=1 Tax=Micromonospora aurantiaca (nom. illeg.) TaxID=47850 RepID=UPI0033CC4E54